MSEFVDTEPFRAWLREELARRERDETIESPVEALALWLMPDRSVEGAVRQLNRWKRGVRASSAGGAKGDIDDGRFARAGVEEALFNAGLRIEDLYPELAVDERCEVPTSKRPDLDARERCSCGRRKSLYALQCDTCAFTRRGEDGRLRRTVDPALLVCACGGPKSYSANTCWACYVAAGGHRGRRHRSRPRCMSEELLREAYDLYCTGFSVRRVAAEIFDRTTYSSTKACANALHDLWSGRGWPLRSRLEAVRDATVVHGLQADGRSRKGRPAAKRWLKEQRGEYRPACEGVRTNYPRRGVPCSRPAIVGSRFCVSHDPERKAQRDANLARARAAVA